MRLNFVDVNGRKIAAPAPLQQIARPSLWQPAEAHAVGIFGGVFHLLECLKGGLHTRAAVPHSLPGSCSSPSL